MSGKSVLLLSNLPQDFNEEKIITYIKQFGPEHARVYMPRNKETFRARGYAFVSVPSNISEQVISTLNNKFMFNKVLKCAIAKKPKAGTFRKTSLKLFRPSDNARRAHNAAADKKEADEDLKKRSVNKRMKKLNKKLDVLKDSGYEFKMTL